MADWQVVKINLSPFSLSGYHQNLHDSGKPDDSLLAGEKNKSFPFFNGFAIYYESSKDLTLLYPPSLKEMTVTGTNKFKNI